MYIQFFIVTMIWIGLLFGHTAIETDNPINFDEVWQEYEHEESSVLPQPIMKGLLLIIAKFMFVGYTLALWFYPYGFALGIILALVSIVNFQWFLYPFLFFYVLHDERKIQKRKTIEVECCL